jgi:hypothetical protein
LPGPRAGRRPDPRRPLQLAVRGPAPLEVDEEPLHELGRPGGPYDLGVDFGADADTRVSAVWPFFGQFLAHDITADRSPLGHRADPAQVRNFRVPKANLPAQISGSAPGTDYASLANRDLQRGHAVGLASGESIARRLGVPALSAEQVGLAEHGWAEETPLWLYILKEADVLSDGDRLGPVGGRIVGEVLVGIIDADPESFRSLDPDWTPTLPARRAGAFGLADILVPGR